MHMVGDLRIGAVIDENQPAETRNLGVDEANQVHAVLKIHDHVGGRFCAVELGEDLEAVIKKRIEREEQRAVDASVPYRFLLCLR